VGINFRVSGVHYLRLSARRMSIWTLVSLTSWEITLGFRNLLRASLREPQLRKRALGS